MPSEAQKTETMFLFFQIIRPDTFRRHSTFRQILFHHCRIACRQRVGRNVFCNHRACAHDRTASDGYARHYNHPVPRPDIVLQRNRTDFRVALKAFFERSNLWLFE